MIRGIGCVLAGSLLALGGGACSDEETAPAGTAAGSSGTAGTGSGGTASTTAGASGDAGVGGAAGAPAGGVAGVGASGGSGGSAGAGASGGEDAAAGSSGTAGGDGQAGAPAGACDNANDSVAVDASYPVPDAEGGTTELPLNRIARQCGLDCLVQPEPEQHQCAIDCLLDATSGALSAGCAACVADTVECARVPCLNSCLDPNDWPGCQACLCGENTTGKNCLVDAYEPCAGIAATTCADAG